MPRIYGRVTPLSSMTKTRLLCFLDSDDAASEEAGFPFSSFIIYLAEREPKKCMGSANRSVTTDRPGHLPAGRGGASWPRDASAPRLDFQSRADCEVATRRQSLHELNIFLKIWVDFKGRSILPEVARIARRQRVSERLRAQDPPRGRISLDRCIQATCRYPAKVQMLRESP